MIKTIATTITITPMDLQRVAATDALQHLLHAVRQTNHDTGKDQQRNAVADAAFGDLFAEPHHEDRSGRQRQHRRQQEAPGRRADSVDLQPVRDERSLNAAETDRQIPRPLIDLLPAHLAFFLQLLQLRRDDRHQLKND